LAYGLQNNLLGCECSNNPKPDGGVESMSRKNGQDCKKRKIKLKTLKMANADITETRGKSPFLNSKPFLLIIEHIKRIIWNLHRFSLLKGGAK
jgi:hypothetical protein